MEFLTNSSSKERYRLIHSHSSLLDQNSLNDMNNEDKDIYLNSIGHFVSKYKYSNVNDSNLKALMNRYHDILEQEEEEADNNKNEKVDDNNQKITNNKNINNNKKSYSVNKDKKSYQNSNNNINIDNVSSNNNNNVVTSDRIQELLQMQQDTFQSEMDREQNLQQEITSDLCTLTDMLKETTIRMHENIRKQNMDLVEIQQEASENVELLAEQQLRMNRKHDQMSMGFFSTLVLILSSLGLFILTFIIIRLFPKPTS